MDDADFVRTLIDLANSTRSANAKQVKRLFAKSPVVFGVWQDASKPYGVDYVLLKGIKLMERGATRGVSTITRVAAVNCRDYEEAYAMRQTWGDRDT
jgi:hypothetical protein